MVTELTGVDDDDDVGAEMSDVSLVDFDRHLIRDFSPGAQKRHVMEKFCVGIFFMFRPFQFRIKQMT